MKRSIFAIILVAIAWQALDFIIHGMLLSSLYQETASLWRPMEEMKGELMIPVTVIAAICFVAIYAALIRPKSVRTGLLYGLLFGISGGISMGLGTYAFQPIPLDLAVYWMLTATLEMAIAGLITGSIVNTD